MAQLQEIEIPDVNSSQEKFRNQTLLRIINPYLLKSTSFNTSRAQRNGDSNKLSDEDRDFIENQIQGSKPFNDVEANTPIPSFLEERIYGEHCKGCTNLSKFADVHDIVVFNEPNPLKFNYEQLENYIKVAFQMLDLSKEAKIKKEGLNKNEIFYNSIGWNSLWKAGSSIPWGHLQTLLYGGDSFPPISTFSKIQAFKNYRRNHKSNLFNDIYEIHKGLDLGFSHENTDIFASLTPIKEKEIIMHTHYQNEEERKGLVIPLYRALKSLIEDFSVNSFNVLVSQFPLRELGISNSSMYTTRIVDRGNISTRTGDIAFSELLNEESVVASDPFEVIEKVRQRF